jgi:hypothetical protein
MSGLFPVPLIDGEPLTSLLSRFARANGAASSRALCRDIGMDFYGVNRGDDDQILRLADLTGHLADDLRKIAVVADGAGSTIAGAHFARHMTHRSKLRFCPHCIVEDDENCELLPGARRHARTYWGLTQVRRCVEHSCLLVEADHPSLRRHQGDLITQLDIVNDQMRLFELESAHAIPRHFERFVVDRLLGIREHGEFLDSLKVSVAMIACELFGIAGIHGIDVGTRSLSEAQIEQAREAGFERLSAGWSEFTSLLDEIRSTKEQANYRGGQALYGKLYMSLNDGYSHPDFDELRERIRTHTLAHVPILDGVEFFGPVSGSSWTSVTSVVEASGLHHQTVRRTLMKLGHLKKLRPSKGERFIESSRVQDVIDRLQNSITLEEVSELLGTHPSTTKRLIADGLIEPALGDVATDVGPRRLRDRYSKTAVTNLRDSILERTSYVYPAEWVSLNEASLKVGLKLVHILRLVMGGQLNNLGRAIEGNGIASLRLDWKEIEPLVESPSSPFVTRAEVCDRLLMRAEAFAFLVRTSQLQGERRKLRPRRPPTWVMTEAEFDKFNARYVTYAKLGEELGVGSRRVVNLVREMNAPLAFPMEIVKQGIVERRHIALS